MSDMPSLVCKYYLQGCCKYGEGCRYDHVRPTWSRSPSQAPAAPAARTLPPPVAGRQPHVSAWDRGGPHQQQQQQEEEQSPLESPLQLPNHLEEEDGEAWDYYDAEGEEWYGEGDEDEDGDAWQYYDDQGDDEYWDGCGEEEWEPGEEFSGQAGSEMCMQSILSGLEQGLDGVGSREGSREAAQEAEDDDDGDACAVPVALAGPMEPAEIELCPWFALRGHCPQKKRCERIHGDECEVCHKMAIHPYNAQAAAAHREECARRHNKLQARLLSAEIECAICYDKVLSAPDPRDRRFGLLSCDHPFCLKCIRGWRATSTADVDTAVRTCPVCRTPCFFITPSGVWPTSAEEKEEIVNNYKKRLSTIDCQYFAQGEGTCPFGSSCFYKHAYPDGTLAPRNNVRRARDSEGTGHVMGQIRLSAFFDSPAAQRLLRH